VLFFGRTGFGVPCYGTGTITNPPPAGYCYDPMVGDQGCHAYPYRYWAWAYDANDLLAVKAGTKQFWEPVPYASWDLGLRTYDPGAQPVVQGTAYYPATRTLYVSAAFQDPGTGYFAGPVVHAFRVR
jgi:hypothetical protein